jgi:hypothetical protein
LKFRAEWHDVARWKHKALGIRSGGSLSQFEFVTELNCT